MESRNYLSGASATPPSAPAVPSFGYPTMGNAATGTSATLPGAHWFYKIGEELRAVILAAGLSPSDADLSQLAKAIQSNGVSAAQAGGSADALTASFNPAVSLLLNGMMVSVRAGSANTSVSPTFTPNSGVIAAAVIVKGNNLPLVAGDIAGAGHWLDLQWDATLSRWVLLNPAFGVFQNSRSAHTYTANDWFWVDRSQGLIGQMGVQSLTTGNGDVVTLPIAFPNGILHVNTSDSGNGCHATGWALNGSSKSSFLGYGMNPGTSVYAVTSFSYLALGW